MGLAAFNRMRQLEAMKPENIVQEQVNENRTTSIPETMEVDKSNNNNLVDVDIEKPATEEANIDTLDKSTSTRRRRNSTK